MPDAQNLYQELKTALQQLKDFLVANAAKIKPAVGPVNTATGGKLFELIDQLVKLLNELKTKINNLNVGSLPGLTEVSNMVKAVKAVLDVSKNLLDDDTTVDKALAIVNVVAGLPTLDSVKADIITLINDIIGQLNGLKS